MNEYPWVTLEREPDNVLAIVATAIAGSRTDAGRGMNAWEQAQAVLRALDEAGFVAQKEPVVLPPIEAERANAPLRDLRIHVTEHPMKSHSPKLYRCSRSCHGFGICSECGDTGVTTNPGLFGGDEELDACVAGDVVDVPCSSCGDRYGLRHADDRIRGCDLCDQTGVQKFFLTKNVEPHFSQPYGDSTDGFVLHGYYVVKPAVPLI